jgi:hypothetical protein
MKDDAVEASSEQMGDLLNASRSHAEHGEPDGGALLTCLRDRVQHHARNRVCCIAQHAAGDRVQACQIGDGISHRDITGTDIRGNIARGHRRNHQLGHTGGQGSHGTRDQGCAAGSSQAQHAPYVIATLDETFKRIAHSGNCSSPVAGEYRAPGLRVIRRDVFWRNTYARGCRD